MKTAKLLSGVLSILLLTILTLTTGSCAPGNVRAQTNQDTVKYSRLGYDALFTIGTLHEIEIVISDQEWQGILDDMLIYAMNNPNNRPLSDTYHKATFIYRGTAGDAVIEEVGFRTKGNVNRPYPEDNEGNLHKSHFKIKFNEVFDQVEGTTEWEDRNQRRFAKLRELELRMNTHNATTGPWDTSQMRELYGYEMMRRAGVNTSRVGATRLWITIGGKKHYFGIYTLIEPIDKSFLTKRYGSNSNDGNLYKCRWGDSGPANLGPINDPENFRQPYAANPRIIGIKDSESFYRPTYDLKTNKDIQDNSGFLSFIHNLNTLSGSALKEYMDEYFDVDRLLRCLAMNVLLGKWDDYWSIGNNYYLYFNNQGKIEFYPTDMDMVLGEGFALFDTMHIGIYDWGSHNRELLQVMFPQISEDILDQYADLEYPLADKIFKIKEYRKTYEHYLAEFMKPENNMFTFAEYERMFNRLYEVYSPYLDNEMDEGEEMYISDTARKYFYERSMSIIKQLGLDEADYDLPVIDKPAAGEQVKQLPALEPVEETSFTAREIHNERYGFSFKLPLFWSETTNTELYEGMAKSMTSGVFVSSWVIWEDNFSEVVKLALREGPVDVFATGSTVLAGGTEARLLEYEATIAGTRMHMYSIGVRREIGWITMNLWNIDRYGKFDRELFEEIAHTLRFEQTGPADADYDATTTDIATDRPVIELSGREPVEITSFVEREILNKDYGFSFKLPADWSETTNTELYEGMAKSRTSGVFVSRWPVPIDDFTEVLNFVLTEGPVNIYARGSTLLASGTEAEIAEYEATIAGNRMHLYSIGVRRGIWWITMNLWNIDRYGKFERELFEEIAHTLRFEEP